MHAQIANRLHTHMSSDNSTPTRVEKPLWRALGTINTRMTASIIRAMPANKAASRFVVRGLVLLERLLRRLGIISSGKSRPGLPQPGHVRQSQWSNSKMIRAADAKEVGMGNPAEET